MLLCTFVAHINKVIVIVIVKVFVSLGPRLEINAATETEILFSLRVYISAIGAIIASMPLQIRAS